MYEVFEVFEIFEVCEVCEVDHAHPTRIYPSQPFLGRSYQNKLMRSNNFEVNVPVIMCIEVEARANNCENKAYL